MDRDFLINYQKKEIEDQKVIYEKFISGDISSLSRGYLDYSKFNQLQEPLVHADTMTYAFDHEKIWSQIPFAGTLLIPITNCTKKNFITDHSFEVDEIPNLIELAKETGKVQFVLMKEPTMYEGLDHLDQIFEELKPPMFTVPWDSFYDKEIYYQWKQEFVDMAYPSYATLKTHSIESIDESNKYLQSVVRSHMSIYMQLKILKWEEAIEFIRDYIYHDPNKISFYLDYLNETLESIFDPFKANQNKSISRIRAYNGNLENLNKHPPTVEIGRYIMKKLVTRPQSYYGCVTTIEHYQDNDLYKLLDSITKGVKARSKESVDLKVRELDVVLDNLWNEAKTLDEQKRYVSYGATLTLGVAGFLAESMMGFGGILASLGFAVGDKLLDFKDASVSRRIIKLINKDFVYNIYDLQKKYRIK